MKYKKSKLPNGVRLITVPMKASQAATVLIMTETGSNNEKKEQGGLSHFLEHMCFKGTTRRPSSKIVHRELDGMGAQSNAFTSNEYTGYYTKAEKRHWKKMLDIVSDMYLDPIIPKTDLEIERGVILQEISMNEDQPQYDVWDVLAKLMYGDNPQGRSVVGTPETVKSFNQKEFLDYHKAHYIAEKTIVVIVGDIKESEIKKEVSKIFAKIRKAKTPSKPKITEKQKEPTILIKKKKTDQTHMVIGFRSYPANDKRNAILSIMGGLLGGALSSRLFEKLRDEMGACYYARASNEKFTNYGVFAVSTGIEAKRINEVLKAILNELKRLKTELVPESELKKVKDFVSGNLYLGLETTDAMSEFYAIQEILTGRVKTAEEYEKELRKVTAKDIQKIARDIFKDEKLNLAIVGDITDERSIKKVLTLK